MSKIEMTETDQKFDDPLGFNDNDSDKTDFNHSALKEYEAKIEKLTSLLAKMKKAMEMQTNKANEKVIALENLPPLTFSLEQRD